MRIEKTEIVQLYIGNYQRLLYVASAILKDKDEASDVVSNVFAKLADGSLTVPTEHAENYLTMIIRNLCIDRIRSMKLRERIEHKLSLYESSQTLTENNLECIMEMIDFAERTFTKQTWRVFQLRFDEGLRYKEIAERLSISETAVYKHLAEALKKLKEKYNPTRR